MKFLCALFLSLGICSHFAWASQTGVLIDRSGSMAPHYRSVAADRPELGSPLVHELAVSMVKAASVQAAPDISVFDTSVVALHGLDDKNFVVTHNNTLLTAALRSSLAKHSTVWLLTDNVQDLGGGDTDMSDFYALLHSPAIRQIHIFPVLERPDLHQDGLLVYAISSTDDVAGLDRQIKAFKRELAGNPRLNALHINDLFMKPLGVNAIDEVLQGTGQHYEFKEGDALKLDEKVQIAPKFSYLYFDESKVSPEPPESAVSHAFPDTPCIEVEKKTASVTPSTVRTDSVIVHTLSLDYGRIRLRRSLPCIWKAAFVTSQVSQKINTPLTVLVPRQNFHFSKAFLNEFAAENQANPIGSGKIAGLDPLPSELADEVTVIPISVPVQVVVLYPSWPAVVLVLLAVVLIAGVVAALVAISRMRVGGTQVSVRLLSGTASGTELRARIAEGNLWVEQRKIGSIKDTRFVPSIQTRLNSGLKSASIDAPIDCTLPDGRSVRILFTSSRQRERGSAQAASAAPRYAPRPRQSSVSRRR